MSSDPFRVRSDGFQASLPGRSCSPHVASIVPPPGAATDPKHRSLFAPRELGDRPGDADASVPPTTAAGRSTDAIRLTSTDITERKYRSLGDITVTLSKWTIFSADPTRAEIDDKLEAKAAALGADAVILVRYGSVGMSAFSYGQLKGSGRAVALVP